MAVINPHFHTTLFPAVIHVSVRTNGLDELYRLDEPAKLFLPVPPPVMYAARPGEDAHRVGCLWVVQPGDVSPSADVRDGEGLCEAEYGF